jgi:hypothetical protein
MSMSALNVFSAVARLSKGFRVRSPCAQRLDVDHALALALLDVAVQVALNHWTKDFYDAIEGRSIDRLSRAVNDDRGLELCAARTRSQRSRGAADAWRVLPRPGASVRCAGAT